MKKMKLGELMLQMIPVMIGVFLGFLISNWTESRKNLSETRALRSNLVAELETNKKMAEETPGYHQRLKDSAEFYSDKQARQLKFFRGIAPALLVKSAFETGIQTGSVNGLSFEEIQKANKIYALQDRYGMLINAAVPALTAIFIDKADEQERAEKMLVYLSMLMTDFVIQEQLLIKEYDELIDQLKGNKPKAKK